MPFRKRVGRSLWYYVFVWGGRSLWDCVCGGWYGRGGWGGVTLEKANLYDLVEKNLSVSTLSWGAVKYLISALAGILLKRPLF